MILSTGTKYPQAAWTAYTNGNKYHQELPIFSNLLSSSNDLQQVSFFIFECSYTWTIYANKVLNMGGMYTFWKQLHKEQKQAKQRYIQMLYNLLFRNLVIKFPQAFFHKPQNSKTCFINFAVVNNLGQDSAGAKTWTDEANSEGYN